MTGKERVARWRLSHPTVSLSLTLQTLRLVNDEALDSLKERLAKAVDDPVGTRTTLKAIAIVTAERIGRALLKK